MAGEPVNLEDQELVEGVLNGNQTAQRAFYDRHVERIFALAYRMTGQEASARDCTQAAFIRLFYKLRTFRGEAALSTWVHTVAVSVILDWRRKNARLRDRETDIEAGNEIAVSCAALDGVVSDAVMRAIGALAPRYRTVVVMHDIEGYTHDEIGAALGITAGASKVRLSRARKRLRYDLADYAGDLAYER